MKVNQVKIHTLPVNQSKTVQNAEKIIRSAQSPSISEILLRGNTLLRVSPEPPSEKMHPLRFFESILYGNESRKR